MSDAQVVQILYRLSDLPDYKSSLLFSEITFFKFLI